MTPAQLHYAERFLNVALHQNNANKARQAYFFELMAAGVDALSPDNPADALAAAMLSKKLYRIADTLREKAAEQAS